jgi:hypothetical protein
MDWWELARGLGFSTKQTGELALAPGWSHLSSLAPYSATACCWWFPDNVWLCWVGVWAFQGGDECQMLSLQNAKKGASMASILRYIAVHTSTSLC